MIKFSKEKVLLLHQLIAEETGGSIGCSAGRAGQSLPDVGGSGLQ